MSGVGRMYEYVTMILLRLAEENSGVKLLLSIHLSSQLTEHGSYEEGSNEERHEGRQQHQAHQGRHGEGPFDSELGT